MVTIWAWKELLPEEGPTLPSQEVMVVDGKVYIAVNNGWVWGQEAGRLGCWDVAEDTYSEWDLGEGAENPVALHVFEGDLFTVNNGDWSSTSVTRASLGDLSSTVTVALDGVSAGCNALMHLWTPSWPSKSAVKTTSFARRPQHGLGRRSGPECGRTLGLQSDHPPYIRMDLRRCDGLRDVRRNSNPHCRRRVARHGSCGRVASWLFGMALFRSV